MADLLSKWKQGLERTRKVAFGRISTFFGASDISSETWDNLEAVLIQADLGVETTESVVNNLKQRVASQGLTRSAELQEVLSEELTNRLSPLPHSIFLIDPPSFSLSV